ncbi:MAG: DEAD/DEAH box helicase, partial [Pseudomonadota bacterium]|nr:DEAD/DEAH box helicase [Pseudomonadota bacterium]
PDDYVHRIGRTGRAGAMGRAFTFVTPEDAEAIDNVEKLTGGKIPEYVMAGGEAEVPAPRDEAASGEPRQRGDRRAPKGSAKGTAKGREAKPERAPKAERTPEPQAARPPEQAERPVRKQPAPREDTPARQAAATAVPARRPRMDPVVAGDDGWNGPVPDFLKFSAINGSV